jgi:N-acetylneuraminic acid mutarotase
MAHDCNVLHLDTVLWWGSTMTLPKESPQRERLTANDRRKPKPNIAPSNLFALRLALCSGSSGGLRENLPLASYSGVKEETKMTKKMVVVSITLLLLLCAIALGPVPTAWAQELTWSPANPMNKARGFFVANELLNGNVLVAGGFDGGLQGPPNFPDSEIYDWHTGLWTVTTPMNQARAAPASLRLENGRVMVIGGFDENFNVLNSAEIYDSRTATWSLTAPMSDARVEDFVAVLLPGRKVLVAGGTASDGFTSLSSAEIFDEKSGAWSSTGSMNVGRGEFSSVVLHDGRILAVGGIASDGTPIASAEIYDPVTAVWTLTGSMSTGRNDFALVLLRDGKVLAAGGGMGDETLPRLSSAEIFDPHTGEWTSTGDMTAPRSEMEHASLLLRDGRVLVPGGYTAHATPVATTDLYDPRSGTWTSGGLMNDNRTGQVALLLRGNRGVMVMGGIDQEPVTTASVDIGQTH